MSKEDTLISQRNIDIHDHANNMGEPCLGDMGVLRGEEREYVAKDGTIYFVYVCLTCENDGVIPISGQ